MTWQQVFTNIFHARCLVLEMGAQKYVFRVSYFVFCILYFVFRVLSASKHEIPDTKHELALHFAGFLNTCTF